MSGAGHIHTHPSPLLCMGKAHLEGRLIQGPGGWGCYLHLCPGGGLRHVLGSWSHGLPSWSRTRAPAASSLLPCTSSNLPDCRATRQSTGSDSRPGQQVKGGKAVPCLPLLQPARGPREPLAVPQPLPPSPKLGTKGRASLTWEAWAGAARSVTLPTSGCGKGSWKGLPGGSETGEVARLWGVASGGEQGLPPRDPEFQHPTRQRRFSHSCGCIPPRPS